MSDFNTKRCDAPGCGKLKQEANHWFVVVSSVRGFFVTTPDMTNLEPLEMWLRPAGGHLVEHSDICGEECLASFQSNWLQRIAREGS